MARVRRGLGTAGSGIACVMLVIATTFENPLFAMLAMGVSCFGNDMCMPGSWTACMDMGGLLAPYTIPIILDSAGGNWDVPILVIAAVYFVGAIAWLGIDPVTPLVGAL